MEREEWEESAVCALCGASASRDSGRIYEFGVQNALCWTCATSRGGQFDAELDTWSVAPDLTGIPDEAYGAAPHEVRRAR